MNRNSKISELKGIGEKTEKLFEKVGVRTVGDLIRGSALIQNRYTVENGGLCGSFINRAMALALSSWPNGFLVVYLYTGC